MMAYQRFELHPCPATVAAPATLRAQADQFVATVARGKAASAVIVPRHLAKDLAIKADRIAVALKLAGCPPQELKAQIYARLCAVLSSDPILFIPQIALSRCHICGEPESVQKPFIAVLTAEPDHRHWLHDACHFEHVRRLRTAAEAVLDQVTDALCAEESEQA